MKNYALRNGEAKEWEVSCSAWTQLYGFPKQNKTHKNLDHDFCGRRLLQKACKLCVAVVQ